MWFTDASFMRGISWAQWIFSQESRAFSWIDPATKRYNPTPGEKKISHTWGKQWGLGHEPHPWHFCLWKFQQVHCLSWSGKVRRPRVQAWWRQPQGGERMPSYQITTLTSCHSSAPGAMALLSLPRYPENFLPQGICTCFPSASYFSHLWILVPVNFQIQAQNSSFQEQHPWPPSRK